MSEDCSHAIVFGASGLIGWAAVNQLLSGYPNPGTFSKVTAVMNRPIPESELYWPGPSPDRPQFQVVSGINLLDGKAARLAEQLKAEVSEAEKITHVFYFVFAPFNDDHVRECRQNCEMMKNVADALNSVASGLRSFVYSGGTRGYGIYVPGGTFTPPLVESMADELPEGYAKTVAYPWFRKILTEAGKGRDWTWSEICPDAVVGFTPRGSGFSLALHWAQFLSLYAFNHRGEQERPQVAFPGTEATYNSLSTPVSEMTLGRISIYAALHRDKCGGKVINALDNDRPSKYSEIWPAIADWFGLEGVGPREQNSVTKPGEYVEEFQHKFTEDGLPKAAKYGVGAGRAQLDGIGSWLEFDRQLSPERLRACGFVERKDPIEGWFRAFKQFENAGLVFKRE